LKIATFLSINTDVIHTAFKKRQIFYVANMSKFRARALFS